MVSIEPANGGTAQTLSVGPAGNCLSGLNTGVYIVKVVSLDRPDYFPSSSFDGAPRRVSLFGDFVEPRADVSFLICRRTGNNGPSIINSSPQLISGWNAIAFGEAIGGLYYSTGNLRVGVDSQAIWEGTLPSGRRPYRVEVFIPRQPLPGNPRTDHAEYLIFPDGPLGQVLTSISQNVSTSQWVDLGTWPFDGKYRVVLIDETGEPTLTRSIVANAVRLTPQ